MKKNYVAPQVDPAVVANEDVMSTSAIQTPWMEFKSALGFEDSDGYPD